MYTVLVADDEYELRRSIIETVDWEQIGFQVIGEAENGVEALSLVETLEPDLLLTDIKMPFISGIDLARRVREIRPSMQIAFLSGYDDFQYAQQAIQYNIIKYLLKPISREELNNELMDIRKTMDERQRLFMNHPDVDLLQLRIEQFLMPLLFDHDILSYPSPTKRIEFNEKACALHLCDPTKEASSYIILVTRFFNSTKENVTSEHHVHAGNMIAQKHLTSGSLYSQGKIITFMSGMVWEIEKYQNIIVNEIVQTAKRIMNQECFIGIGSMVDDISKTHTSYNEACNAIDYGLGEKRNITFINDIERKDTLQYQYIEGVSMELEHLMKSKKEEEVEGYLQKVFSNIASMNVELADVDLLCMHLVSMSCTLVRSLCDDITVREFFAKASELSSLLYKHTLEEKKQDIHAFCRSAKLAINKQNRLNAQVICDELMALINVEYTNEDFSLTMASEQLFISASYLSAILKKIKKESFVVLLTKKRMEIAKDLVLYSTSKILEIARSCGYSDQHYFSYCFKQQYGISPNKMREQQHT